MTSKKTTKGGVSGTIRFNPDGSVKSMTLSSRRSGIDLRKVVPSLLKESDNGKQ